MSGSRRRARSVRWPSLPPARQTLGLLALAVVGLGAGLILTRPAAPTPLVALAGASLAFVVPGAAVTRALFPGPGLGRVERAALVLGIQLSLVVIGGLLLHLLRPGLSPASWGALLAEVTLIACAIAWFRGRGRGVVAGDDGARSLARTSPGGASTISSVSSVQLAMLIGAGLVAALALVVARAGVAAQPQPPWTALGIATADGGRAVSLGITNAEGQPETYRVTVTIDGESLSTLEGLTLANGASSDQSVTLPPTGAFLREIDVGLWRASDPPDGEPYRSVRLSLRGAPGP